MNRWIVRLRADSIAGNSRKKFKGEVRGTDPILVIEKPIELRHAVPPSSHERGAFGRHEWGKLLYSHMPIANVVVTRVVQARFLHLVDRFDDIAGLEARIQGRIGQVHIPFIKKSLGFY